MQSISCQGAEMGTEPGAGCRRDDLGFGEEQGQLPHTPACTCTCLAVLWTRMVRAVLAPNIHPTDLIPFPWAPRVCRLRSGTASLTCSSQNAQEPRGPRSAFIKEPGGCGDAPEAALQGCVAAPLKWVGSPRGMGHEHFLAIASGASHLVELDSPVPQWEQLGFQCCEETRRPQQPL